MKYAPKKVFIKENGNYIEITNEEHELRKATDEQYAKRWFIPLQGCLLEVDEAFYTEHYKEIERNKYLRLLDRKKKLLSIEAFDTEDDNGVDYIADEDEDVEKRVTDKLMAEKLWLNYFNQTLYEKGFLTEGQRNRLKLIIDSRKPSAKGIRGVQ